MIDQFRGEYRWLSNFHEAEVEWEGEIYPTNEHAYQAAKHTDPIIRKLVQEQATPKQAMIEGRKFAITTPDWHKGNPPRKFGVMLSLTRQKFTKHPELAEKLLATGDQELAEGNWWGDCYWGVCAGVGDNNLGKILMMVRDELRVNAEVEKATEQLRNGDYEIVPDDVD